MERTTEVGGRPFGEEVRQGGEGEGGEDLHVKRLELHAELRVAFAQLSDCHEVQGTARDDDEARAAGREALQLVAVAFEEGEDRLDDADVARYQVVAAVPVVDRLAGGGEDEVVLALGLPHFEERGFVVSIRVYIRDFVEFPVEICCWLSSIKGNFSDCRVSLSMFIQKLPARTPLISDQEVSQYALGVSSSSSMREGALYASGFVRFTGRSTAMSPSGSADLQRSQRSPRRDRPQ